MLSWEGVRKHGFKEQKAGRQAASISSLRFPVLLINPVLFISSQFVKLLSQTPRFPSCLELSGLVEPEVRSGPPAATGGSCL